MRRLGRATCRDYNGEDVRADSVTPLRGFVVLHRYTRSSAGFTPVFNSAAPPALRSGF